MRLQTALAIGALMTAPIAACGEDDNEGISNTGSSDSGTCQTPPCNEGGGSSADGGSSTSGERSLGSMVEIAVEGPERSEDDELNPFLNMRLVVTFQGPDDSEHLVRGFFAGNGEGGGSGRIWKARFIPDQEGDWHWKASLIEGNNAGIAEPHQMPGEAEPVEGDGTSGAFTMGRKDEAQPLFYRHGPLLYAGAFYLKFRDGPYWIKGGADSPENFLGYQGFDNTRDLGGGDIIHTYEPHINDWNEGDPDWTNEDGNEKAGRGIIGALNYLASEEVNSIYFLPCNIGGDGQDTWPYIEPDDLLRFDVSKLHQWDHVFAHAQSLGIALHVVLAETEAGNENLHDEGELGPERKLFYAEMVSRLGGYPAVFWNIGEENDYGAERQKAFARYIRSVDAMDHPLTVHTHANNPGAQYNNLLGDTNFDMTSIQLNPSRAGEFTETWRRKSEEANRPWVVMLDEIGPAGTGVTDENAADIRKQTLWPGLLSGSGGVEWYFGYHALPLGGDLKTEDFRTREEMWRYTRYARLFLEAVPFWEMEPRDDLLANDAGDVFYKEDGSVLAVYVQSNDNNNALNLEEFSGAYTMRWFDPREGRFVGSGQVIQGGGRVALDPAASGVPANDGKDWVILYEK